MKSMKSIKRIKQTLSFVLALLVLAGLCACAQTPGEGTDETGVLTKETTLSPAQETTASPSASKEEPSRITQDPPSDGTTVEPTPSMPTPSTPTPSDATTTSGLPQSTLSEEDVKLFKGSYDILRERITGRGYAITSLTGTYVGMFTRDSSIQAMAHIAYGDSDAARAILRYLLSYHAALGLKYGIHIIDQLKEEEYGNSYLGSLSGTEDDGRFYSVQREPETEIYNICAPAHGAAQTFVPSGDRIYGVEAYLKKSANTDTVRVSIRTDYKDPASSIVEKDYVFGRHESGWQSILFEEPVGVTPGQVYYLVLQATKAAGNVVWNGTTRKSDSHNSFNYDQPSFGGWVEKPYDLAFEILSVPLENAVQTFSARGTALEGVEIDLFFPDEGGRVTVKIYSGEDGALIGSAGASAAGAGVRTLKIGFDKPVSLQNCKEFRAEISFEGCAEGARVLIENRVNAQEQTVAVNYRIRPLFDADRLPLIALEVGSAGVQEIPNEGEIVSSVKVLLSKEGDAVGRIRATLVKGEGENAQTVGIKEADISFLTDKPNWVTLVFDLPLFKTKSDGSYYLKIENLSSGTKVFWHGTTNADRFETTLVKNGETTAIAGDAAFEALRCDIRLISDYTQTDTTYMLVHAWVMFVNGCKGTKEDKDFIEQSYPIIKSFANYYLDSGKMFNKKLNLLYNPSLEHSRKGRYWQAYDLITNVFASQALYELSAVASSLEDQTSAGKWMNYAKKIEKGINDHLVTEYDGKKIYGEFYDAEDNMKFYPGISWVNFAPVAAEWYGMDLEIMKNTYEVYKKYAGIKMLGYDGLATDATLGTNEIRRELIGKGTAWELMFCSMTGDKERVGEIMALERATAKKYKLTVYPESWTSQNSVSDPGNQEHCAWQVYAVCKAFPELRGDAAGEK